MFKNVSFCQPYENVHILKKRNFLEPSDQKKWIPHSIYNQNHYILAKKFFLQFFFKIGQNYDFFHPFSTTTQQGIENRGVAVMSRIAPIILKLYRYASILSSGYILVQEFASSTLTSLSHPYCPYQPAGVRHMPICARKNTRIW